MVVQETTMTIYYINTGSGPNAGNGDSLRVAFNKVNANFAEIVNTLTNIVSNLETDGGSASTVYDNETLLDGGGA